MRLATCCGVVLLSGCPQMLEDDFGVTSDEITASGGAGATADPAVGGTGSTAGSAGVAGNAGTEDTASEDRASVLSSLPADGARGVLPDATLVFVFSAPMHTDSVEAAYSSLDLPAPNVSFTWSEGDTVLEIQPETALQAAAGTNANAVVPIDYSIALSAQAKDKLGHALVATEVSFSVARSITQTLNAVQNRDLTGNWRSDSSYGIASCERADTTICVGDGALTDESDPDYKALMTFDLGSLPSNALAITDAELSLVVSEMFGTPFTGLGTLQVEHVEFSSIGDEAFAAPALSTSQLMSTDATLGDQMGARVLADVQSDWGTRNYSQFRLAFDTASDQDDAPDHLICNWNTARLDVTYWLP
jgi:hypothetical protein